MTWDNRDQHAPFGCQGRARAAETTPGRVPVAAPGPQSFPAANLRIPGRPPAAALKYERIDGPADVSNAPDADALLFQFSGRPDTITLSAQTFGAIFTLTDRLRRELTVYHVPAGSSIETFVARDTVLVRNAVAASVAIVHCVGKWAELDEPSSAY